ncbi:MAG: hypothetical protein LUI10_00055 [Lachnospiraceae bacterium]|nr:hypothetical protein [Lachnospiraceae bacterium]
MAFHQREVSFADYLEAKYGCVSVKEAVSGTTLVESGADSYISRLKILDIHRKSEVL